MTTYVFDIDGTICTKEPKQTYADCKPLTSRIEEINYLYDLGYKIVFHTARGMGSSNNNVIEATHKWYALTQQQLKDWGVKHHLLVFGKPAGDLYIDDKGTSDVEYFGD